MGDATVDQQRRMRQEYVSFANLVSSAAYRENATWPMYRVPNFELHAAQVRLQSGSEVFGIQSIVEQQYGDQYLEFVTANYEDSLREGHQTLYGNLDRLIPVGYNNNFTTIGRDGKVVVDNMERPLRSATWQISPRKFLTICDVPNNWSKYILWNSNSRLIFVDLLYGSFVILSYYQLGHIFHPTRLLDSIWCSKRSEK